MWRQPKTVWSVAFACVVAFMGIGLVDPILKPIADELDASAAQVSLLFTSYLAVMGVAMLGTGWVSSRIGAKRTLLLGLVIIIAGAGLAGTQDSVTGIVGFRAVWGLGNALFIATALSAIVGAARGSVGQAIILYEAALGLGIAAGPLLGGALGSISYHWPFYGVAILMSVALAATAWLLPDAGPAGDPTPISAPIRALAHGGLLTLGVAALLYNVGFFTLLAFTPFPLDFSAAGTGLVFFGWGLMLAFASVVVAPRVQRRVGTYAGIVLALTSFAVVLAVMALGSGSKTVLVVGVVVAGAFLGLNNTLITEAVMKVSPVERGVASAAYSFVRFSGGALAPFLAGTLGDIAVALPFWMGAVAVLAAVTVLVAGRAHLRAVDELDDHGTDARGSAAEAQDLTYADA
ncbi:MFS transporter [Nocardioidaceae bacterium]|nr:MFS transporter [Nocardioidaceae bacterium]